MISIIRRLLGRPSAVDLLEKRIGRRFKDRSILVQSLTHSSYAREHKNVADNERLEFLGDAVLQLIASEHVYQREDGDEGWMTKTRSSMVCGEGLLRIARELDLGEHVLLGKGEKKSGGHAKKRILEDCVESIVGAIYQDGGLKAARKFLDRFWGGVEPQQTTDHKTTAQEVFQRDRGATPGYRIVETTGPAHQRRFVSEILVAGDVLGRGEGTSIKAAEQAAARNALDSHSHAPSTHAKLRPSARSRRRPSDSRQTKIDHPPVPAATPTDPDPSENGGGPA